MDKSLRKIISITIFLIFIFGFLFSNLYIKPEDYLFFENRKVTPIEEFSLDNIKNSSYFSSLSKNLSDTFIFRENILKLGTYINLKILNRPVVNNLFIDDHLILHIWKDNNKKYPKKDIEKMTSGYKNLSDKLKKNDIKFIFVGIPEHSSIYSDQYPNVFYNKGDEWLQIENDFFNLLDNNNVSNIKMRDYLSSSPDKYYNSTDHHFNFYGAIKTYEAIIKEINTDKKFNLSSDNIDLIKLDGAFKGSYSRKLFNLDDFEDEAIIYDVDFDFTRRDDGEIVDSKLFDLEKNLSYDYYYYNIYMGGDVRFTHINTDREELPNILVYGDSFTNPVETLLARNANNLWSIDFRYYKDGPLLDIVKQLNPDYVICIRDNLMYIDFENNGILK